MCNNPRACADPPGSVLYDVLESVDNDPFTKVGEVCLTSDQAGQLGVITIEMVQHAFQTLTWPESPLLVQPPNGRTLVNLATNFLTTNTQPTAQAVPLLGQQVEIEATPDSWTWHYGDGQTETTRSPGAAYPHLEITHTYLDAGPVTPSVDTVYSGRYRINGGGWQQLPDTLTVPGTPLALQVLQAQPVLVGSP